MRKLQFICLILCMLSCHNEVAVDSPWTLGPFSKPAANPILQADSSFLFTDPMQHKIVRWQKADVFNPAAIVRNDTVFLLFRAEDNPAAGIGGRTSRIGLAYSADGIHFAKFPEPVLYPDSSLFMQYDAGGGCEDPRVVETPDSMYVMMYTSWDTKTARVSVATSRDLYHWEKKGPAFAKAQNGKYINDWSKSGSIVTWFDPVAKRLIAKKINGKYWMYYGDRNVNIASSENLLDWEVEEEQTNKVQAMAPRKGMFDSDLTEPGPPALLTNKGILLLYNGRNATDSSGDKTLSPGTYSGGQALFDSTKPAQLISRTDTCFIRPDLPHEKSGQYTAGTTFIEGLVFFKGKWFLYYGTADSMTGVAVSQ